MAGAELVEARNQKLGLGFKAVRRGILGHSPGTMTASYTHSYVEARERAVELVSAYGEARKGEDCVKMRKGRPCGWPPARLKCWV